MFVPDTVVKHDYGIILDPGFKMIRSNELDFLGIYDGQIVIYEGTSSVVYFNKAEKIIIFKIEGRALVYECSRIDAKGNIETWIVKTKGPVKKICFVDGNVLFFKDDAIMIVVGSQTTTE